MAASLKTQQIDMWGREIDEIKDNVYYVHLGDRKEHEITFQEDTPTINVSEKFGKEYQIKVFEDGEKKKLTMTRKFVSEMIYELESRNINMTKLMNVTIKVRREGKGFNTKYNIIEA